MTQSNTSSPRGRKYLLSPRGGDGIEVPQNEEISGGGENGGRKGIGYAIRREERIGEAYTLRNDTKEELLREMLTPT